jgi:hypothetical protein
MSCRSFSVATPGLSVDSRWSQDDVSRLGPVDDVVLESPRRHIERLRYALLYLEVICRSSALDIEPEPLERPVIRAPVKPDVNFWKLSNHV